MFGLMRTADGINLIAFAFLTVSARIRPLAPRRRMQATAVGAAGASLVLATQLAHRSLPPLLMSVVSDWLPAPLMLLVYWQAGRFFRAPNDRFQAKLAGFDHKVLDALLRYMERQWWHTWLASYLELAYLLCYVLVPLGIGILYMMHLGRYADEYWAIVLPSAYLCHGTTAFIQTLPPRMLAPEPGFCAHPSRIRALNMRILRHASIQVNTFPSAHVASTMAAALAMLRLAPPVGLVFLWVSLSIAAGAVAGRYHYAADALAAAAVTLVVFLLKAFCSG